MGRILVDPSADYSSAPVGHTGLYTSITSGLDALHELRYSRLKACNNAVPGVDGATPYGGGANSFATGSMNVDVSHGVRFGIYPNNGGQTIAFIVKIKNGGVVSDGVVSAFDGGSNDGYVIAAHYNRRVQVQVNTYAAGSTPPLSGFTELLAYRDYTAGDDGTYRLFFATLENNVALTLYDQKAGTNMTVSATGRDFVYDDPPWYQTSSKSASNAQDVGLFAHWTRVLSSGDRATFYGEMQSQFAKWGIAI